MPIRSSLASLSASQLQVFVAERRAHRAQKIYELKRRPESKPTVAKLAKVLGISKDEIVRRVEKALND